MGEYPYEGGEPPGICASAQMDTTKLPSKGTPTNPPEILGTCLNTQMNTRKLSSIYKHYQLKHDNYMTN